MQQMLLTPSHLSLPQRVYLCYILLTLSSIASSIQYMYIRLFDQCQFDIKIRFHHFTLSFLQLWLRLKLLVVIVVVNCLNFLCLKFIALLSELLPDLYFFFFHCWILNPRPYVCQASAVPLNPRSIYIFFKNCVCFCCLHVHMYNMCAYVRVCVCAWSSDENIRFPRTEMTDGCETLCGCQELNLGPTWVLQFYFVYDLTNESCLKI